MENVLMILGRCRGGTVYYMASWITHMMIADRVLKEFPLLDPIGFCVGNIAPDCNVENEDWSVFIPSREVTHWMSGERKAAADCEQFWNQFIEGREFLCSEEQSFFLGYYAHLVADTHFQLLIRDEERLNNMFSRLRSHTEMSKRIQGTPDDFDAVKRVFSKRERLRDVDAIEYEYLEKNPQSGYLTVLRKLEYFPDYMDIFPKGAYVRKAKVMALLPDKVINPEYVFFSRDEYFGFVEAACEAIMDRLKVYFE